LHPLRQVARRLRQVEKHLAQVMGPTAVPRAALARAPPLVTPQAPHRAAQLPGGLLPGSSHGGAAGSSSGAGGLPALPAPSDAGTTAASLASRAPAGGGGTAAASVATAVHGGPGSGGAGPQRLQLDKLLSLLESGLPLGGDVKVRLLAARALAGGAERHTHPYARLTVGAASVTSPPLWATSEPVWDHEETFEEVGGRRDAGLLGGGPYATQCGQGVS
jgi:hypothetical protein